MTLHTKRTVRLCALPMTLCMLLSTSGIALAVQPEAEATLVLSDTTLALVDRDQAFTATLTVDASLLDGEDPADWAAGLTWYLTREEGAQDTELYPYYYTGDQLDRWQVWNDGEGGEDLFTLGTPEAVQEDGTVTVILPFTATSFTGINDGSTGLRNVWPSFIGPYTFSVRDGDSVLAETEMTVNAYDSYTRYDDVDEAIQEIMEEALPGRYITVTTFGQSEGGRDQYYVTLSDSEESVEAFHEMKALAETDPASLQAELEDGTMGEYRVPFLLNNVHPDEDPGVDAQLKVLRALATQETITYNTLTGFLDESVDISSMFAPDVLELGITGLGSQKFTADEEGQIQDNTGVNDASELYTISEDIVLDVDDILDDIIFVIIPNENPDGRTYNTRRNDNGFDLNRDASNQTQSETVGLAQVVNEWDPVVFAELHGYMTEFLVEPCTPPHEPNMEYDILVENFALGSEAFGAAALGTMSATREDHPDSLYWSYYMPLRDDYDPETMTWSAWDDLCTNYGPSYAMLNCGSLGYTIETPYNNEASTDLFVYGIYGLIDYVMENKDDIYYDQLEFFRRGIENEDHRADMEKWYVDVNNGRLPSDTWRAPYAENDNFFPEYYVIPVDSGAQRDIADAYEMGEFLLRNGVKVSTLDEDTAVDGTVYAAGSLVVDMHQAKRNYANAVLWEGADASASGFPDLYSESVSNFPAMRGFDCVPVAVEGAFDGVLTEVTGITGGSQLTGTSGDIVILSNSGNEAVRAVNALLDAGETVGMVTGGDYKGDFVLSLEVYESVADDFVLSASRVTEMPEARAIEKPTIFLAGRYDAFSGAVVEEGYFSQWFSQGYGYTDYRNVYSNGTSNYDVEAFQEQLGFTITGDPAQADIILGNVSLDQGESGAAAVAAVKAGTPYIATGSSPLRYIASQLVPDMAYTTLGMEALHTVTYPSDSLTTASYASDGDDVMYTYNCGVITSVPEDAAILIQAAPEDSFIAGCCLNDQGLTLDGFVEAIALERDGMDLTIFANSVDNRAHQQDDYRYVTNTIYAKMLSDERLDLSGGEPDEPDADEPATSGDHDAENTSTVVSGGSGSSAGSSETPDEPTEPEAPGTDIDDGETPLSPTTFTDEPAGHWASEAIAYVTGEGYFNGTSETTFGPSVPMSRAMLATVLWRMEGQPAPTGANAFTDVAAGQWYTDAVTWAAEQGIVTGIGNGLFDPNGNITREQLAVMLYRYAGGAAAGADLSAYPDASSVSSWAVEAMGWAVSNGILSGNEAGQLSPGGAATRAEVAQMLLNYSKI